MNSLLWPNSSWNKLDGRLLCLAQIRVVPARLLTTMYYIYTWMGSTPGTGLGEVDQVPSEIDAVTTKDKG